MTCCMESAWCAAILCCNIGFAYGMATCATESLIGFLWARRPASRRQRELEILRLRWLATMLD